MNAAPPPAGWAAVEPWRARAWAASGDPAARREVIRQWAIAAGGVEAPDGVIDMPPAPHGDVGGLALRVLALVGPLSGVRLRDRPPERSHAR